MQLKSIELSGFKSFPKKSALEFKTPISAIVGPNGSGKSNVAEAFRFVLGEQSMKSMRGKKGEDLIWNGALDAPRSNRASVKVTFDNTEERSHGKGRLFNIDFDEVVIERIVHRDGVNEYFLNGTQVRLRDIIELLSAAHIGASGHHIISQGEADRILNSNEKERREMLEDALGLKIYQYKRLESERKLEKTLENIKSVESLRRELAPHLKFLKKQVEKIEKLSEYKNELTMLAKEYLKREFEYMALEKENIRKSRMPLEKKKNKLSEDLNTAKKILESSKLKDAKSDEVIDLENKIQKIRVTKDRILEELGKIHGEISSEERVLGKLKNNTGGADMKTVGLSEVEDLANEVKKISEEANQTADATVLKRTIQGILTRIRDFIEEKKTQTDGDEIKNVEKTINELKERSKKTETELDVIKKEEKDLEKKYSELRKEIEEEKDSNRDAEKDLFRIASEENTVLSELRELKTREESLSHVEEEFKRELEECSLLTGEVIDYKSYEIEADKSEQRTRQEERRRTIEKIKIRLEDSGVSGSVDTLKEFNETSERDAFLERELKDLDNSAQTLKELIEELKEKLDVEFKSGIHKINTEFQKFFDLMFGGGKAELKTSRKKREERRVIDSELEDTETDDFVETEEETEGIEIEVSLPRKKIKGLAMLSGGERALTSIALLFAMSQVNPPPFIILDETDAALDEANSRKYGDMIESLSKHSQLILVTHNRETMSRAGIIYGITMASGGSSKVLSIQFEEAVAVAK